MILFQYYAFSLVRFSLSPDIFLNLQKRAKKSLLSHSRSTAYLRLRTNPLPVKQVFLLTGLVFLSMLQTAAQPSFFLNIGTLVAAEGDDPFRLQNTWTPLSGTGSNTSGGMVFYEGGTATVIKLSAMWDVSEIFSAGLAYKMIKWNLEHNYRSSDMNCLGAQFRVNFTKNSNKVIPFFQGAFYFSNNNTLTQQQATEGSQTQPAFNISTSTGIGFDADLGIEFKIGKSWGAQLTAGYGGTQATDPSLVMNLDYGAYIGPTNIDGVFNYAFTGGIKYYTGRGSKKRDF